MWRDQPCQQHACKFGCQVPARFTPKAGTKILEETGVQVMLEHGSASSMHTVCHGSPSCSRFLRASRAHLLGVGGVRRLPRTFRETCTSTRTAKPTACKLFATRSPHEMLAKRVLQCMAWRYHRVSPRTGATPRKRLHNHVAWHWRASCSKLPAHLIRGPGLAACRPCTGARVLQDMCNAESTLVTLTCCRTWESKLVTSLRIHTTNQHNMKNTTTQNHISHTSTRAPKQT